MNGRQGGVSAMAYKVRKYRPIAERDLLFADYGPVDEMQISGTMGQRWIVININLVAIAGGTGFRLTGTVLMTFYYPVDLGSHQPVSGASRPRVVALAPVANQGWVQEWGFNDGTTSE